MIKKLICVPLFASSLFLAGCSSFQGFPGEVRAERDSQLVEASYKAVDSLISGQTLAPQALSMGGTGVLVSTIVDINDLNKSSPLGRLLSEQISSRFAQLGVPVNELKLRGNLFVSQTQGELLLSRELREISASQKADLVLVGTYAVTSNSIYVTLKLVRASDSRVSNAYNFNLPKSEAIWGLVHGR